MNLHKQKNLVDAYNIYEELFKLDVISNHYHEEPDFIRGLQNGSSNSAPDELAFVALNVKSLRYLVFRNRGFLYLDMLKSGLLAPVEELYDEKFKNMFYTLVDDFCVSLFYQDGDEFLLEAMYEIFVYLGIYKLAKGTLEYWLGGDSLGNKVERRLKIIDMFLGGSFTSQVTPIAKRSAQWSKSTTKINTKWDFLHTIKSDYRAHVLKSKSLAKIEIPLNDFNWSSVVDSINRCLKKNQDIKKKVNNIEPYLLTEESIERVTFVIVENKENEDSIGGDVVDQHMDEETDQIEDAHSDDIQDDQDTHDDKQEVQEDMQDGNQEENQDENLQDEKLQDKQDDQIKDESEEVIPSGAEINNTLSTDQIDVDSVENADESEKLNTDTVMKLGSEQNTESEPKEAELTLETDVKTESESSKVETKTDLKKDSKIIQRSSKRLAKSEVDIPVVELKYEFFVDSYNFFASLNGHFERFELTFTLPVVLFVDESAMKKDDEVKEVVATIELPTATGALQNILEAQTPSKTNYVQEQFISILHNWMPAYSKSLSNLIPSETLDSEKFKLIEVLNNFNKKEKSYNDNIPKLESVESNDEISKYLIQLNSQNLHYHDVKINIIKRLIGGELLVTTRWEPELYKKIKDWILQFESFLLVNITEDSSLSNLGLVVSVQEILVDSYISLKNQINSTFQTHKKRTTINALTLDLLKINDKLKKWSAVYDRIYHDLTKDSYHNTEGFFVLYCRYNWCEIQRERIQNLENEVIMTKLNHLLNVVKSSTHQLNVILPNYENLLEINMDSIKSQLTSTSVMGMFSKIIQGDSKDNKEAERLLGIILSNDVIDLEGTDLEAITSIKVFLSNSPVDMKLSLWSVLFSYYDGGEFQQIETAFVEFLTYIYGYLHSEKYLKAPEIQGKLSLVKILGALGDIISIFLRNASKVGWILRPSLKTLEKLIFFTELLYIFTLHEEASTITIDKISISKKSKGSHEKLKDIFVGIICCLVIYYGSEPPISAIHEHLGLRQLCSSSAFLRLAQDISTSPNEISQIISCRYHYDLSIGNFTPTDHSTSSKSTLDLALTLELSKFVFPLCKNAMTQIPKHGLKSLLDEFYEVIGDPNFESLDILSRNSASFDYFLDTARITPRFIRDGFHGLLELDFERPSENFEIVDQGLYYLQGLLVFTSYKVKKKNMQSRIVELEHIIMLLKNDLIFGTKRLESWFLLGQAYGFLVEDDLIWTADKLTVPERKLTTANLQRKSLICYLMAVNEVHNNLNDLNRIKSLIGSLMSKFGKEMYSACLEPMNMHAFEAQTQPKFVNSGGSTSFVPTLKSQVTLELSCRIMQQCFHLAIKADKSNWLNYYYLSKVQRKLKKSAATILRTMQTAGKYTFQLNEYIVEPHYSVCSMVYKYVKLDELTVDEGLNYLKKDSVIGEGVLQFLKKLESGESLDKNGCNDTKESSKDVSNCKDSSDDSKDKKDVEDAPGTDVEDGTADSDAMIVDSVEDTIKEDAIDEDNIKEDVTKGEGTKDTIKNANGECVNEEIAIDAIEDFIVDADTTKEDVVEVDTVKENIIKDDSLDVTGATFESLNNTRGSKEITKTTFYKIINASLRIIDNHDKKNWHHKPRYRLARILFDEFDDHNAALTEMNHFISLKTTSKSLISIWKPEFERPGKHFYYTYQYCKFFIQLLTKNLDLTSLISMLPKLKRSNSIMINLYNVWENICQSICKIIRSSFDFEVDGGQPEYNFKFSDRFIQVLPYNTFMVEFKTLLERLEKDGIPKELEIYFFFLYSLNDIKKANNGFGPTSLIDDTLVCTFFRVILHYSPAILRNSGDTPGKVKKIAKRDIFPFVVDILKISRKGVEAVIAAEPEMCNVFVRRERKDLIEIIGPDVAPQAHTNGAYQNGQNVNIQAMPPNSGFQSQESYDAARQLRVEYTSVGQAGGGYLRRIESPGYNAYGQGGSSHGHPSQQQTGFIQQVQPQVQPGQSQHLYAQLQAGFGQHGQPGQLLQPGYGQSVQFTHQGQAGRFQGIVPQSHLSQFTAYSNQPQMYHPLPPGYIHEQAPKVQLVQNLTSNLFTRQNVEPEQRTLEVPKTSPHVAITSISSEDPVVLPIANEPASDKPSIVSNENDAQLSSPNGITEQVAQQNIISPKEAEQKINSTIVTEQNGNSPQVNGTNGSASLLNPSIVDTSQLYPSVGNSPQVVAESPSKVPTEKVDVNIHLVLRGLVAPASKKAVEVTESPLVPQKSPPKTRSLRTSQRKAAAAKAQVKEPPKNVIVVKDSPENAPELPKRASEGETQDSKRRKVVDEDGYVTADE